MCELTNVFFREQTVDICISFLRQENAGQTQREIRAFLLGMSQDYVLAGNLCLQDQSYNPFFLVAAIGQKQNICYGYRHNL